MIGGDRPRVRVILVKSDAVREIGAEFGEHAPHPAENEIGLAAALMMMAEQRVAGRARDRLLHRPAAPIIGLVAGQEHPRPGLDSIGIGKGCSEQLVDRSDFQRHRPPPSRWIALPRSAIIVARVGSAAILPVRRSRNHPHPTARLSQPGRYRPPAVTDARRNTASAGRLDRRNGRVTSRSRCEPGGAEAHRRRRARRARQARQ